MNDNINNNELLKKYKNNAKLYLEDVVGKSEYEEVTQGGEFNIYFCPNCDTKQFVQYDYEKTAYICLHCGKKEDVSKLKFCSSCGEPFKTDDITECFCSKCLMSILENKD